MSVKKKVQMGVVMAGMVGLFGFGLAAPVGYSPMQDSMASYYHNTGTDTTSITTGGVVLERVVVGATAAGVIVIYDGTYATGDTVAVLKVSIVEGTYDFGVVCTNGLSITVAAASRVTVVYRRLQ